MSDDSGLTAKQKEIIDRILKAGGKIRPIKKWCQAEGLSRASVYRTLEAIGNDESYQEYYEQRARALGMEAVGRIFQVGAQEILRKALEGQKTARQILLRYARACRNRIGG